MAKRSTNLDVRAYATSKGLTLGDISKHMGITQPQFSVRYMGYELPQETKDMLFAVIDEVSNESKGIPTA